MSAFDEAFREISVPKIAAEIRLGAAHVAMDVCDYSEACNSAHALANRLGSAYLDETSRWKLADWINAKILREIDAAGMRNAATEEKIEAAIQADPVEYYSGLASRTSDPTRFAWIFAATCPEYRAYLIETNRAERAQSKKSIGSQDTKNAS